MTRRLQLGGHLAFVVVASAAAIMNCSGRDGALIVTLVPVPPDPFLGVERLRATIRGPDFEARTTEVPATSSQLVLADVPFGSARELTIDGLSSEGTTVSSGKSDPFALSAEEPAEVSVNFINVCLDEDGDGFRACDEDCDDGDEAARPGQTEFFSRERMTAGGYDFDCDADELMQLTATFVSCVRDGSVCRGDGWSEGVPDCGAPGANFTHCERSGGSCVEMVSLRQQACR